MAEALANKPYRRPAGRSLPPSAWVAARLPL